MIGIIVLILLLTVIFLLIALNRDTIGYDLMKYRYTKTELAEGKKVYERWFDLNVKSHTTYGSIRFVLTPVMIKSLEQVMDPKFAVSISPKNKKLHIVCDDYMFIDLR